MLKDSATYTSKRSCLRTPFANERVNEFHAVLKSARHNYYPLFLSIRVKLSCKKSALVWCEILSQFVYARTADDNYSRQQYAEFTATISNAIIWETKNIFRIFYCISEMCMKLGAFSKKRWASSDNYFRNYWCWETWLHKRLKGLA